MSIASILYLVFLTHSPHPCLCFLTYDFWPQTNTYILHLLAHFFKASFYLIQHNINELISTTANNSKMNQKQQLFILIRVHIINI